MRDKLENNDSRSTEVNAAIDNLKCDPEATCRLIRREVDNKPGEKKDFKLPQGCPDSPQENNPEEEEENSGQANSTHTNSTTQQNDNSESNDNGARDNHGRPRVTTDAQNEAKFIRKYLQLNFNTRQNIGHRLKKEYLNKHGILSILMTF